MYVILKVDYVCITLEKKNDWWRWTRRRNDHRSRSLFITVIKTQDGNVQTTITSGDGRFFYSIWNPKGEHKIHAMIAKQLIRASNK